VDTCARCGADLGVGRFCLNCGHQVGAPVPPHQQLLPWDDPTDESAAPAPPPLKWVPWVAVAAVALVGLGVVATFLVTGADEEPAPRSTPSASPDDGEQPDAKRRGKARNVAATASITVPSTAPATNDLDGQLVSYDAGSMADGAPTTAWRMVGDGTGATITLEFPRDVEVVRVGLLNGYAKQVAGVDWYPHNRRVRAATWGFDDGSSVSQSFSEKPRIQRTKVPATTTRTVTLTLTEVTPPGPGEWGRDYTALSEIVVIARPVR
jgi:hypothetical protein